MDTVGFTGTQKGMSDSQKAQLRDTLERLEAKIIHHGGCVGADTECDDIVCQMSHIARVVHPSDMPTKRGLWHAGAEVLDAKLPLERNKDIVDACDILLAAPAQRHEIQRSGTWATVRYAKRTDKEVIILW